MLAYTKMVIDTLMENPIPMNKCSSLPSQTITSVSFAQSDCIKRALHQAAQQSISFLQEN